MTKASLTALVNYLTEKNDDYMMDIKAELEKELNRNAEKAQANRDLYAAAHDVVIEAFAHINDPVTISELWEEIKGDMPEGFAKGKLQYAMTRMWREEFGRNEGKVNTYFLAK